MKEEVDQEKLQCYLNASFDFFQNLLFLNFIRRPNSQDLSELRLRYRKHELERLYNHVHLSAISENAMTQQKYAIEIWKAWRLFLSDHFPEKKFCVNIEDFGSEIVIYVYQAQNTG